MNIKGFFAKNWAHFAVLALFIIVSVIYFSPEFDGYHLKQHDVEQHKGMSNEIEHFREATGDEPLWTNSMFGGMPAIQISTLYHGNIFQKLTISFLRSFGVPSGIFLLHLIGFYILAMCLRIKPIIAVFGAFAFALASYEIVIMQAGHNSKAIAMAFMAPVLGAFIMSYRNNWKWGVALSAFFMTWELAANHLQVTYYLGILLFFIGLYELVRAFKEKKIKQFAITSVSLIAGYLIALMINYGNISLTNDYAKHSIRGKNDITMTTNGEEVVNQTSGLDKDYITNWSYGIGESFTLVSPYVKGSHSAPLSMTQFSETALNSEATSAELKGAMDLPVYWGTQPMTSGPVYLGVIVVFLAFLGMIFIQDRSKWIFLGVAILALMLSWGKNFMGLTDFFIDNVPGYNKFRTVTIILVLLELITPVLGVMLLQKLYNERESIKEKKKTFLIASGGFILFLIITSAVGLGDNYVTEQDLERIERSRDGMMSQLQNMDPAVLLEQYGINVTNTAQVDQFIESQIEPMYVGLDGLKKIRKEIYSSSMTRSIVITFFGVILIGLFFYTSLSSSYIVGGLIVLLMADLIPVDRNYLGSDLGANGLYKHWVLSPETLYPITATSADQEIMDMELIQDNSLASKVSKGESLGIAKSNELEYTGSDKRRVVDSYKFAALNMNTNYRVFDFNGGWGSSRASYFHKSLGGYHGAKLRNIQNLFEFHIAKSNNSVLDMLNVKYLIQGETMQPNPTALGPVWLVKNVETYKTANDEIRALGGRFALTNTGSGRLLINNVEKNKSMIFGGENLVYLSLQGDSISVPLSNGIQVGMTALFVADKNGKTNLIPEQTMALDTANSFISLVSIKLVSKFNPKETAVMLDSEAKKISSKKYSAEGEIKMTSYAPNRIAYSTDLKEKQFAVFSEIYYPEGWKAFVDGKEQDIVKVNYLLRGLELPQGKHKVEFKFDLPKYHKSNTLAVLGTVGLLLIFGSVIYFERKNKVKITTDDSSN